MQGVKREFPVSSVAITCVAFAIALSPLLANSADCPFANERRATAADAVVKNGTVSAGTCYDPNAVGIGQTPEEAKLYLKSLPRQAVGGSRCAPPENDANIDMLNDTFATCAARFLKTYQERYGYIVIRSAYRSPSGNACAGGASGSNHQKGLAMDVNPASQDLYPTMWQFARSNPQFGVCFPYLGGDRPHMALAGTGTGEAAKCAGQGVTQACTGSFDPSSIRTVSGSPSSGLADGIRQSVGLGGSQNCTLPDGLVVPCSAIANSGGGVNAPGPTGAPTGAAIPRQTLPASQQPLQYLPSPTPVSNIVLPPTPSIPTSTSSTSTLTTFERIMRFAEATRIARPSPTSAPLVLITSIRDAATIQPDTTSVAPIETGTIYEPTLLPVRQDTFTSSELGGNLSYEPQLTPYQKTLADMKATLLTMLEYLKPFGRPAPVYTDGYY